MGHQSGDILATRPPKRRTNLPSRAQNHGTTAVGGHLTYHGHPGHARAQAGEAVKKLNLHFFARLFSLSYRRTNRYFSINSQLRMPVVRQASRPRHAAESEKCATHSARGTNSPTACIVAMALSDYNRLPVPPVLARSARSPARYVSDLQHAILGRCNSDGALPLVAKGAGAGARSLGRALRQHPVSGKQARRHLDSCCVAGRDSGSGGLSEGDGAGFSRPPDLPQPRDPGGTRSGGEAFALHRRFPASSAAFTPGTTKDSNSSSSKRFCRLYSSSGKRLSI